MVWPQLIRSSLSYVSPRNSHWAKTGGRMPSTSFLLITLLKGNLMKLSSKLAPICTAIAVVLALSACTPQQTTSSTAAPAQPETPSATPAAAQPALAPVVQAPTVAPAPCANCGVVRSITAIVQAGTSTGIGAAIGAVAGGLAGNQVGGGSGNTIATAAGAIGGAVLGNTIERNRNGGTSYDIVVDMESGGQQTIRVPDATGINQGSAVTIQGGNISLR